MSPGPDLNRCEQSEATCAYALQILPASEVAAAEAHIASCPDCQRELESLRPVVDQFVAWPTDVLRPTTSLQGRLAHRIAEETGKQPVLPPERQWSEPDWEQVAPGIQCKLLAADGERHLISMLVRLAPGASYPTHTHAGVEELHLLDGELWIEDRKLVPGDYNYGPPGHTDVRVWSETGCTCVLVTSTRPMATSRTIHIVDDDPSICRSLERLLHSAGFTTDSYASSLTFLAVAPQLSGDCILLEVKMPDLDGIEVQTRLRRMGKTIAVIMMTGHGDVRTAVSAMKSGAVDFIEKPFKDEEVLRSIEAAIADDRIEVGRREVEDAARQVAQLSRREREVLEGLSAGKLNKIIAHDLGLSVRTIEGHRVRMMERLGVRHLADAVRLAVLAELSRR